MQGKYYNKTLGDYFKIYIEHTGGRSFGVLLDGRFGKVVHESFTSYHEAKKYADLIFNPVWLKHAI